MKSTSQPPRETPQKDESWQADVGEVVGDEKHPLWFVLVTCPDWDLILAHSISEQEPPSELLWNTLLRAMQCLLLSEPHRPAKLLVRPNDFWRWKGLGSTLAELDIALVATDDFDPVDGVPELINEVFVEWQKKYGK